MNESGDSTQHDDDESSDQPHAIHPTILPWSIPASDQTKFSQLKYADLLWRAFVGEGILQHGTTLHDVC